MSVRRYALILVSTLCCVAVLPASAGASKRYNVDAIAQSKFTGNGISVRVTGKPFGLCTGTVQLTGPGALFSTACHHSRINVVIVFGNPEGSSGTWKVTSGSHRYKHARGSGTFSGNLTTLRFRLRGALRY